MTIQSNGSIRIKSKLSNKYPVAANPLDYLIGETEGLDPILAGRLAAIAKDNKTKLQITSGYRSSAEQIRLYNLYKVGKLKSAAKPGTSWHEFRLAVDTSTQPIRLMGNDKLKKYGLCKPIKSEGWHIQPIETNGQADRKRFEPILVKEEEEELKKSTITAMVNGSKKTIEVIQEEVDVDGKKGIFNYAKLQDLEDIGVLKLDYQNNTVIIGD